MSRSVRLVALAFAILVLALTVGGSKTDSDALRRISGDSGTVDYGSKK